MRRRILSFIALICLVSLTFFGLTSCGDNPKEPEKLVAPIVTLVDDLATWEANPNAEKFEISLSGELSYVENSYVSKKLTDGQTLKVRAIGDGTNYTTSDWSNVVTYTASQTHTHDFSGAWEKDATHHWKECECGAPNEKVAHSGGTATTTEKAKCEVCGQEYGELKQPEHECDFTGEWEKDATHHWHKCSCGEIDRKVEHSGGTATETEKAKCEVCGQEYGELKPHEHSYSILKYDEEQHWFECECGDAAKHEKHHGGKATTTEKAVCEVCGQPYGELAEDAHEHNYNDEYSYDEKYHWHECECGDVIKKTEHSGGTATTTEKAVCLACGQEYGELAEEDPIVTTAPTYIGITASNYEPDPEEVRENIQLRAFSRSVSLEDSLRAYLSDPENALGQELPTASDYEIYSQGGNVVYIQIWLNNPDQNTILSLKLNGTKYQTGGALQSFFVEYGESYLNCVYVAVTIPAGSYNEISYEVTEIEYVEGSNVSQDGKAVLIDENNDTVTIGLPYEQSLPTVTISNVVPTASTVAFDVNVVDEDNYVELVGGWLRVVIIDGNRTILGQEILKNGDTSVLFKNLSADDWYSILVFVLGDAHDGNGVYVHALASDYAHTERVITYESSSEILLDEETDKYYPELTINATLSDQTFTFTRVEICNYNEEVLYTSEFNGSIKITEGISFGSECSVVIYYENEAGIEQSYRDYAWIDNLDHPNFELESQYGLIDDAVIVLSASEGKFNLESLMVKVTNNYSLQYIAEEALYLLDNPNAIAELEALMETLDMRSQEYYEAYTRRNKLQDAKNVIERYYSDATRQDFEEAAAKGKEIYTLVYGVDEEFIKGKDNKYYIILKDYQTLTHGEYSMFTITGLANEESPIYYGTYRTIDPMFSDSNYLFIASDEDYNELFKINENNELYLEVMSRNNDGDETYRALGYVRSIDLYQNYEIVKTLWSQAEPNFDINEEQWLETIIDAIKNGDDIHSICPTGNLEPITVDLDTIDLSDVPAGEYYIRYTYKMFEEEYSEDYPYAIDGWLDYIVEGPLPTASININTGASDAYGTFEIVIPESLNNGYWYNYTIEVRDENENLVGTYNQDNYYEIGNLRVNYSIRIKLDVFEHYDYYTEGEWSEWFICSAAKCDTPTNFSQDYTGNGVSVYWDWVNGTEKYIYILNDGEEQETSENALYNLKDGDTVKVKAVPSTDSSYLESDYSEVYIVEDTRTPLATPVVTYDSSYGRLTWQAVENASRYEVYDVTDSRVVQSNNRLSCYVTVGHIYIIKALPDDYFTYCASQTEEISTIIKLTAPEIHITSEGLVSFSEYHDMKSEGIDMAIMNTGGVRASIDSGDITRAEVFEVFPFNNAVVLVNMSGALIKEFYGNNSGYMYMDMDDSISSYTALDDDTIYQLAVIDYVFENTRYEDQFGTLSDEDYIQTDIILRDLLMDYLDVAY